MLRPPSLLLVLCLACSTDPLATLDADLQITPLRASVRAGDSLGIILTNRSSIRLLENLCAFNLQRDSGLTWVLAASEPSREQACPDYARAFPPGRTIGHTIAVPAALPSGRYRVVFEGIQAEAGLTLLEEMRASGPFNIQ